MEITQKKDQLAKLFGVYEERILKTLSYSEVEHVGSGSFLESGGKGDLDIQVRVSSNEFERAVTDCSLLFERFHEEVWTEEFALFIDFSCGVKTDIMLTVIDSGYDNFFKIRDAMIQTPFLQEKYISLKNQFADFNAEDYRKAKNEFFRKLEADLGLKIRPTR